MAKALIPRLCANTGAPDTGLTGMRERAKLMRGQLAVWSGLDSTEVKS